MGLELLTTGVDRWTTDMAELWWGEDCLYQAFPKQLQFHASCAKYRLFGGAAGPGKSMALLMDSVNQAAGREDGRGIYTLLLRRTFPELEGSLLALFRRFIPREMYARYNDQKHVVEWLNGANTRFGFCQRDADVWNYQGHEYLSIGLDELTRFSLKQWQTLGVWNRCSVPGTTPNMAGATNPIGLGHVWVKALWIDKRAAPSMENPQDYDPNDYDFIPATLDDNPIYANDPNYRATLVKLPPALRAALYGGRWDILAGVFFDHFDVTRHVIRAETMNREPWWPVWVSMDWGFEHPAVIHWHTISPQSQIYTFREFSARHLGPRTLAHEIIDRSKIGGEREKITAFYLGPDAFAKRTDEDTIAEQIGDVLAKEKLPRPAEADNDRIGGWMLMYELLNEGQWFITDNCTELIDILPMLPRDVDGHVEDILKMEGDDPADCARYGLKSRLRPPRPPIEQRVAAKVTATDPTARAMQVAKALAEERKGAGRIVRPHRWRPTIPRS